MSDLHSEAEELESIVGLKPTPLRRALVQQALGSKWEGSQALAVKALARWGDQESIDAIRKFLEAAFERPEEWAVRGVAIRELANIAGPEDAEWVLELYRSRDSRLERHELRHLMNRLALKAE